MIQDWPALGLNNVEHTFGTKFGVSSNPLLRKALKDKKKSGNCFAYSMLWCRQCIKLNRKILDKSELITHTPLMIAAQAMQSWQVRQNRKGTFGVEGMLSEVYYQAMAAAFCISATEVGKDVGSILSDHNGWLEVVTATEGCYVIAFIFAGGGAHAVAVLNKGRDLIFFDPNYGQYSVDNYAPWEMLQFQIDVKKGCDTYGFITNWIAVRVT
ncbi:YopT-type cysteine protease domain-containing protein [Gallaecimonas kandeliae]|uniref:YopT-type cysteine protease domain-containing protein n=1 Tax=Gallaecimonas kandeliae TaxID=3029055 RepID=UPI0026493581|nr:YopT-type cysteine protease domain-containing protein [Gallaecimonas kandeliae]WKE64793.1 YopT-type cysteine protease domain-containing protein [Gallaecimonas kandeliae]